MLRFAVLKLLEWLKNAGLLFGRDSSEGVWQRASEREQDQSITLARRAGSDSLTLETVEDDRWEV